MAKISKEAAKAISAGSTFSGTIIFGYFLGDLGDRFLGWGQWGPIGGVSIGFIIGNWLLFRILLSSENKNTKT